MTTNIITNTSLIPPTVGSQTTPAVAQTAQKEHFAKLTEAQGKTLDAECRKVRTLRPKLTHEEKKKYAAYHLPAEISYTIEELHRELGELFSKELVSQESLLIGGSFAGHVLTETIEFIDVDGCWFLDTPQFNVARTYLFNFIKKKMVAAGFIPAAEPWVENFLIKKYLTKCKHVKSDAQSHSFAIYGLGSFELKIRFTRLARGYVTTSDGFFISVREKTAHCLNCSRILTQEEYEKTLADLRHRHAIIRNALEVRNLHLRVVRILSQGFRFDSISEIYSAAFEKFKESHAVSDCKGLAESLQSYFKNHLVRHSEQAAVAHFMNFLPILFCRYGSEEKVKSESQQTSQQYVQLFARAWKEGNLSPHLLQRTLTLLEKFPEDAIDLHAVLRGLIFFDWIKGTQGLSAYTFPFAENAQTPRLHLKIELRNGPQYIAIDSPLEMMNSFLKNWRKLQEKYAKTGDDQFFKDLHNDVTGITAIELNEKRREEALTLFINAVEKPPLSEILRNQFQGQIPPHVFYETLLKEQQPLSASLVALLQQKIRVAHLKRALEESQKLNQAVLKVLLEAAILLTCSPNTLESYVRLLITHFNTKEVSSNSVVKERLLETLACFLQNLRDTTQILAVKELLEEWLPELNPSEKILITTSFLQASRPLFTIERLDFLYEIENFITRARRWRGLPDDFNKTLTEYRNQILKLKADHVPEVLKCLHPEASEEVFQRAFDFLQAAFSLNVSIEEQRNRMQHSVDFFRHILTQKDPDRIVLGLKLANRLSENELNPEQIDLMVEVVSHFLKTGSDTSTFLAIATIRNLSHSLPPSHPIHRELEKTLFSRMAAFLAKGDARAYEVVAKALLNFEQASEAGKALVHRVARIDLNNEYPTALKTFLVAMIPINFSLALGTFDSAISNKTLVSDEEFDLSFIEEQIKTDSLLMYSSERWLQTFAVGSSFELWRRRLFLGLSLLKRLELLPSKESAEKKEQMINVLNLHFTNSEAHVKHLSDLDRREINQDLAQIIPFLISSSQSLIQNQSFINRVMNCGLLSLTEIDFIYMGLIEGQIHSKESSEELLNSLFDHFLNKVDLNVHPQRERFLELFKEYITQEIANAAYAKAFEWLSKAFNSPLLPTYWPQIEPLCYQLFAGPSENWVKGHKEEFSSFVGRCLNYMHSSEAILDKFFVASTAREELLQVFWSALLRSPISKTILYAKCESLRNHCKDPLDFILEAFQTTGRNDQRLCLMYLEQCARESRENSFAVITQLINAVVPNFPEDAMIQAQLYVFQYMYNLRQSSHRVLRRQIVPLCNTWERIRTCNSTLLHARKEDFQKYLIAILLELKTPNHLIQACNILKTEREKACRSLILDLALKVLAFDSSFRTPAVETALLQLLQGYVDLPQNALSETDSKQWIALMESLHKRGGDFSPVAHCLLSVFLSRVGQQQKETPEMKLIVDEQWLCNILQANNEHLATLDQNADLKENALQELSKVSNLLTSIPRLRNVYQSRVEADIKRLLGEIFKLAVADQGKVNACFAKTEFQLPILSTYHPQLSRVLVFSLAKRIFVQPYTHSAILSLFLDKAKEFRLFFTQEDQKNRKAEMELTFIRIHMLLEAENQLAHSACVKDCLRLLSELVKIANSNDPAEAEQFLSAILKIHDVLYLNLLTRNETKEYHEFLTICRTLFSRQGMTAAPTQQFVLGALRCIRRMLARNVYYPFYLCYLTTNIIGTVQSQIAMKKRFQPEFPSLQQLREPSESRFDETAHLLAGTTVFKADNRAQIYYSLSAMCHLVPFQFFNAVMSESIMKEASNLLNEMKLYLDLHSENVIYENVDVAAEREVWSKHRKLFSDFIVLFERSLKNSASSGTGNRG